MHSNYIEVVDGFAKAGAGTVTQAAHCASQLQGPAYFGPGLHWLTEAKVGTSLRSLTAWSIHHRVEIHAKDTDTVITIIISGFQLLQNVRGLRSPDSPTSNISSRIYINDMFGNWIVSYHYEGRTDGNLWILRDSQTWMHLAILVYRLHRIEFLPCFENIIDVIDPPITAYSRMYTGSCQGVLSLGLDSLENLATHSPDWRICWSSPFLKRKSVYRFWANVLVKWSCIEFKYLGSNLP